MATGVPRTILNSNNLYYLDSNDRGRNDSSKTRGTTATITIATINESCSSSVRSTAVGDPYLTDAKDLQANIDKKT